MSCHPVIRLQVTTTLTGRLVACFSHEAKATLESQVVRAWRGLQSTARGSRGPSSSFCPWPWVPAFPSQASGETPAQLTPGCSSGTALG